MIEGETTNMTNKLKQYIEQNIYLIDSNLFDKLFENAKYKLSSEEQQELIDILVTSGISTNDHLAHTNNEVFSNSKVHDLASNILPFITNFSGDDNAFMIEFEDDLSYQQFKVYGTFDSGKYNIKFIVTDFNPRFMYIANRPYKRTYYLTLSSKQLSTLFSRIAKEYSKRTGEMSARAILKGWKWTV